MTTRVQAGIAAVLDQDVLFLKEEFAFLQRVPECQVSSVALCASCRCTARLTTKL